MCVWYFWFKKKNDSNANPRDLITPHLLANQGVPLSLKLLIIKEKQSENVAMLLIDPTSPPCRPPRPTEGPYIIIITLIFGAFFIVDFQRKFMGPLCTIPYIALGALLGWKLIFS